MFNQSETTVIAFILLIALGILVWGFNRAKSYGKLGIIAWLQSVVLISPWLIFFGLYAARIYLNLVEILFLLFGSIVGYIFLGNRLRTEGQDAILQEKAAERIKAEQELKNIPQEQTNNISEEMLPIQEQDLKIIKGIFGIDTFFATETISYQQGAIFKGNLRGEADKVYERLSEKLQDSLADKYRLFLVEDPEGKPVVIVLPSSNDPPATTFAQKNLALVLLLGTIASSLEMGSLLLGFDFFSNLSRYQEVIPLSLGLWIVLAAHEIGHYILARRYKIRLSVPFFIPSWQIGSFGAITRFESLIPHRTALFDVALAGPAFGGIVSLLLLITGLLLSSPGSSFQIPIDFFQSSILVGSLAKVILGTSMSTPLVNVHPLTVIGWLGLTVTALNLLPAGKLDGGRIVQAIYGRKTARRATIATLIVLGIIAIVNPSNPIALYWGILILFLQRDLERPSLNELTEPNDARAAWGLLALFLMLATLIPLSPSLAGRLGIGS